jgi:hypothetical protein
MAKDALSHAYGVFKPVGHVVVAFPSDADCREAAGALLADDFKEDDITAYSPQQMLAQVEEDLTKASALAGVGQELNLVKAHGELARQGSSFLVVRAHDQHAADRIAETARRHHASRAQRYGTLLIEELIPVGGSDQQVAESPARGLDAQTRSGREDGGTGPDRQG